MLEPLVPEPLELEPAPMPPPLVPEVEPLEPEPLMPVVPMPVVPELVLRWVPFRVPLLFVPVVVPVLPVLPVPDVWAIALIAQRAIADDSIAHRSFFIDFSCFERGSDIGVALKERPLASGRCCGGAVGAQTYMPRRLLVGA